MFLPFLFSFNCLILPKVTIWHPFFHWWNHQKRLFNLVPRCHHNPPPLLGVSNFLFLASMQWHCQDILLTNYEICIMTRYLFTKSNFYRFLLMRMSYSDYHHCFQILTTPPKCKAWIESMVAMLGARWSQPISKIVLGLTSRRLVAWVSCVVFKMIMKTLCIIAFTMKSFGAVNTYIPVIG